MTFTKSFDALIALTIEKRIYIISDMKMLSIPFMLFVLSTFSCQNPEKMTLVGKTIEYHYGQSKYHVAFDSDSTLRWMAMAGGEIGAYEDEIYFSEWVGDHLLFITWGEANGTGVSQILDFEKGKVYNHLLRGREISAGQGEIQFVK